MYNKFYGFRENPFSLLPDPDFLYVSREHGTGLNLLELAIRNQSGFCALSGEIGAGKTTIVRELLNRLDDEVRVGFITNTHAGFTDLMRWILAAFELKADSDDGVHMHRRFTDFVSQQFDSGRRTLLIIDEAQNLSVAALEQLRMLSNINSGGDMLLQIILIGQSELRENLRRPELEQLAQRISIEYFLAPLGESETTAYIEHRVVHAGGKNPLFDGEACARIYKYSRGIPRVINRLCDLSLIYGYAENSATINAGLVDAAVAKRQIYKRVEKASRETIPAVENAVMQEKPELIKPAAPSKQPGQVKHRKPEPRQTESEELPIKAPDTNVDTEGRAGNKEDRPARRGAGEVLTVKTPDISADEAVKRREQLEDIAAEKAEYAIAAVEAAARNLAALQQAESQQLEAERRLEEAVSVDANTSQSVAAAGSAAEKATAERKVAEAAVLEKKKAAGLALEQEKVEKTAAEKRVAQIAGIEEEARATAERATAAAEKARAERLAAEKVLAERVAAEKVAAEEATAATDLVDKSVEERTAAETEIKTRLAEVEPAAAVAAAELDRANEVAVEKISAEKAARAQAEACAVAAKKTAAERAEASQLAEEKIKAVREIQKAADASREAAEKAATQQAEAEKAAVASAAAEKLALATIAADEAAEALRMAEMANAAKQTALREAADAKAAAAAAAQRADVAKAAAEKVVENNEMDSVVEVRPVSGSTTEEHTIKELFLSEAPEIVQNVKARGRRSVGSEALELKKVRGRRSAGRAWAAMAAAAIVAGASWFVTHSDDSVDQAGPDTLAGREGTPKKNALGVTAETAAMEISGKPRKPDK